MSKKSILGRAVSKNYLLPFILVSLCFALWGFANDITNPMVKAFSKIFRMSVTDGALVQMAFYGGYFAMALPAALFIKKFSYKSGLMMGLGLYALGALMFIPAKVSGNYYPFLLAYFVLTCGLSFLETSANPYILSMGDNNTATRRLNLAQAFNPIGSLLGMYVAMNFIQVRMDPMGTSERALLNNTEFEILKQNDLAVLVVPYVFLGIVLLGILIAVAFIKMPAGESIGSEDCNLKSTLLRLVSNKRYREGVIAQFFYVGVQIMCWTFIIQYGTRVFMGTGMIEQDAEVLSQKYNIVAMCIFCVSRFICTYLLKFINAGKLLALFAVAAIGFLCGVIFIDGIIGIYCLVAVSACMSLMFPTIYGISLEGVSDDAKIGAAGLIMAILGGSVLPPLQARMIDAGEICGMPAVNMSFILPLCCFIVIAVFGYRSKKLVS